MKLFLVTVLVLVGGGSAAWYFLSHAPASGVERLATYQVSRQNLLVSVTEGGTLEAANEVNIVNEVEGQSQIIYLIAEGTNVKKGDLLVELDSSDLLDKLSQQQITYQNALSTFTRAQEDLEIQKSQNESNIRDAELNLDFGRVDLEKYRDGDWPQERKSAIASITIAEAELIRAKDRLTWTEQLQEKGYATRTELEADRLSVTRRELDLEQAREKLRLLEKYEYPQRLRRLEAEVERRFEELARVRVRAASSLSQKQADMESKEATLELQESKLNRLKEQLVKTRVVAPQAGMVVYASSSSRTRNQPQIVEGANVRQRQDLIRLPDTSQMRVEVKIHESRMNQISLGQRAYVIIDAMPDRRYRGRVSKTAVLPDAQSNWLNPNLKVYSTEILIEDQLPSHIKPGLSAKAEIIIDRLDQVIAVPIQAVTSIGDDQVCFVDSPVGAKPVKVEVGAYTKSHIHILAGLQEGDLVLLNPPVAEGTQNLRMNVVEESDVTAADTEVVVPVAATVETTVEDATSAEALHRRFEALLAQLPEDKRDEMRQNWESMDEDARRQVLRRHTQTEGGRGRRP